MQFVVIGYDGTDTDAPGLRQKVREDHLAQMRKFKADGNYIFDGALLNEQGGMIGSIIVVDFPARKDVDVWLSTEPYVIGKVWERYEVRPFQKAPVN